MKGRKLCCRCKLVRQLSKFNKSTLSKDGYRSECVDCRKEQRQKDKQRWVTRCPKCGLTKPLSDFYSDRSKKDGRMCDCRSCHVRECMARAKKNKPQGEAKMIFTGDAKKIELKKNFWNRYQLDPEKPCNYKAFQEYEKFELSERKGRGLYKNKDNYYDAY